MPATAVRLPATGHTSKRRLRNEEGMARQARPRNKPAEPWLATMAVAQDLGARSASARLQSQVPTSSEPAARRPPCRGTAPAAGVTSRMPPKK